MIIDLLGSVQVLWCILQGSTRTAKGVLEESLGQKSRRVHRRPSVSLARSEVGQEDQAWPRSGQCAARKDQQADQVIPAAVGPEESRRDQRCTCTTRHVPSGARADTGVARAREGVDRLGLEKHQGGTPRHGRADP